MSELAVPGAHCRVLLQLWTTLCGERREACARETRRLLPSLVQLAWRWSHGHLGNTLDQQVDNNVEAAATFNTGIQSC